MLLGRLLWVFVGSDMLIFLSFLFSSAFAFG